MTRYTTQCGSCNEEITASLEFDFYQLTKTELHTIEEDFDNVKKKIICPHCNHENTIQLEAVIRVKEKVNYKSIGHKKSLSEFDSYISGLCEKSGSNWFHKDELADIVSGWMEIQRGQRKEAA